MNDHDEYRVEFELDHDEPPSPEPTPGLRARMEQMLRQRARGGEGLGFNADMHEEAVVAAILADPSIRAALAASPAPEPTGLDAAWAEAEAALPEGWAIQMVWGTITEERWAAEAGPWPSKEGDRNAFGGGDTPAAALRALAARLTGEAERG